MGAECVTRARGSHHGGRHFGGTGGPGCKLRDAITAANTDSAVGGCPAGSGADTIELPAGSTITLTVVDNSTDGPNGLPSVTSDITVDGNGATRLRRANRGRNDSLQ